MKKLIIVSFTLLLLTGCGQETIVSPVREEIKATATNLGAKKSDSKPVILINDGEDTLYIGETDFNFDVEAYSDNGEVTITFDDSAVDYKKEGSYQVKVLVEDPFEQGEDNADLTLKKKPAPVANPGNGSTSSGTGENAGSPRSGKGIYFSCFNRTFYSFEEFEAFINDPSTLMQPENKQGILERYRNVDFS